MKQKAKDLILERLKTERNLALFEFKIRGCSEAAISARLRELASVGLVVGHFAPHENFKRWNLSQPSAGSDHGISVAADKPGERVRLAPVYMTETGGQIEFKIA